MSRTMLPAMLRYQNDVGMTLSPSRSEAIHCTRKRVEKIALPTRPNPDRVRDARGDDAHDAIARAAALEARAAHAVGVGERREEARDVRGVVLQVGVDGEDDPSARRLHAGPARRRLAAVGGEALHAQT